MNHLSRWPLLSAATVSAGTGVALDIATYPALAAGAWTLAAVCVGAFVYAEGARHREWREDRDTPDAGRHAGHDPGT